MSGPCSPSGPRVGDFETKHGYKSPASLLRRERTSPHETKLTHGHFLLL